MAKISKVFQTTPNDIGDYNSIDIEVDYSPVDNTFSVENVYCWNSRKSVITDITEIFYTVAEFSKIADQIDWREVYYNELAEKEAAEEIECEND